MLSKDMIANITGTGAKALATYGSEGLNVIPVSIVTAESEQITLYDFFMGKTIRNLTTSPQVALVCWSGFTGIQIKAIASYVQIGAVFDQAVIEMRRQFPTRVLKGLVILVPEVIYDISADTKKAGTVLTLSS